MKPEIQDIPLRRLTSGVLYTLRVLRFKGINPGPGAYIQAGLHGGELQGTAVTHYLATYLTNHPPLNDVILVPQANPYGRDLKIGEYTMGRNDPITGDNWNRQFTDLLEAGVDLTKHKNPNDFRATLIQKVSMIYDQGNYSFGKKLALILQQLALEAKCVLDLHADSISVPYVYSPTYAATHARLLGIPYIIETPCQYSPCFNQSCFYPWWQWGKKHITDIPFISYTVELGSKETIDLIAAEKQANGILNLLKKQKIIAGNSQQSHISFYNTPESKYRRLYAEKSGLIDYVAPLGHICQKGDIIARVLDPQAIGTSKNALQEIYATEKSIPLTYTSSRNVLEGQELLKYITL